MSLAELAPTGTLRAGINMSNFLLVSGGLVDGVPVGVSPDLARAIAAKLGVPVQLVPYPSPGLLADDAGKGVWDIGLIGAEPARAQTIDFTPAYAEIESTYLVPAGSAIQSIAEVDRPGVRIAVTARAAFELFVNDKLDVLAGLRPRLLSDVAKLPGARILDGQFTAVQQAVGTAKGNASALAFLRGFIAEAKTSGLIAGLIAKHQVQGLSVAP